MKKIVVIATLLILAHFVVSSKGVHPRLMLTQKGVEDIRVNLGKNHLIDTSYSNAKQIADLALSRPIEVPEPLHVGGGYSHEKHKSNYTDMYNAGVVYQISGDSRYAEFIRKMLLDYAKIYPSLPPHPAAFTKTPGKIFYQVLNEAVWLTFVANAYDCVYDYIPTQERALIERDLFRPLVEFMENGVGPNYAAFNSMHNFGTWMAAGAGMIGYVMGEREYVDKALKGSTKDGKVGFIRQLDELFSPDGYYDEGPGYQRYAIFPFVTLAECVDNNQPELKMFEYRDAILPKAVNTLLQTTYEGDIFLMNDAISKNIHTYEILFSTNIAYKANPSDKGMLGMIEQQGVITLTDAGAMAAIAIARGESKPFDFKSEMVRVGIDGDQGGLGIIRGNDPNNTCVTLKATTHGGEHGHFDRLSMIYFANGSTIIPDYGSARFINVDVKAKGGYAPENKTFAQLSIAHNTVTVDSTTHFKGVGKESLKQGCVVNYSNFDDPKLQIISASEHNAYPGVAMRRTIALLTDESLDYPCVLDIFRMNSDKEHIYDLPYYYNGHFMSANYDYKKITTRLEPLGESNGYQHLWREAVGSTDGRFMQLCWLEGSRFYTLSTTTTNPSDVFFVKTGANDPDYNLIMRNGVMYRNTQPTANNTIVSLVEPHGNYDLVTETTRNSDSSIKNLEIILDNDQYTVVRVTPKSGEQLVVAISNGTEQEVKNNSVTIDGKSYQWSGYAKILK